MLVNYLKYKITLVIDNLVTNNLDKLTKTITRRNVELEVNTPIELDKKNILNYFTREIRTYCTNNRVDIDNLTLDGYEIESKTKGVDVYFRSEDINNFSYEPSIMANLLYTRDMPVLRSEQINDTTIKWFFEDNQSINYLKDETDKIIAELPLGVDYYIESDLTPGETYTRYITATNQFNEQLESTPCSLTLRINQKASIYDKFKVEKRKEDIEEVYTEYSDKLKAFASGIGDNEDCMVYKADDLRFSRRFLLYNKIYGIRASNDIKHNTIKFTYRYLLRGIQDYLTYDAKFKVKVTATRCVDYIKDPDPTLFGTPMVSEKELVFTLDDKTQVANIYMYQFFPNLLPKDYKRRYKFDIEISEIEGKSRVYSRDLGYHNLIGGATVDFSFTEKGYFDHEFTVAGIATEKQKEYIEYYPPLEFEPLVGAVNGDFEESPEGIYNMTDTMNLFETSPSVYDKKYYCEFHSISPAEGYVKYKFDNQIDGTNYTETNGDKILFYSDAVFADDSEHREFITQTEVGPYIIDDNKMHKYHYDIKDIHVDLSAYKRFELSIVPSINDIVLLSFPKTLDINNDGTIDMPVDVTCRNLQSAIAKWAPSVHNGYYYYNQKEFFLYSKCVANGQNVILDSVYEKENINVKVVMTELGPALEEKEYHFRLYTKEDLLLDDYHYEWSDDKVWPKPVEVYNDYYMEFAPYYEYHTSPFVFETIPTKYNNISWDETGMPNSEIDVYAIAYDDVYGTWYPPVKITNGGLIPEELKLSKVLILKFVLKPSRKPRLQTRTFLICSESDWKSRMLKFLSYNLYYDEEILMPKSRKSNGVFVSQFIDMGDTIEEVKGRSIKFDPTYSGDVEFYIQQADSKVELTESMKYANWERVEINTVKTGLKRFIRYMIILKPNSMLYYMDLTLQRYEYTGMNKEEYLPGFGNIFVDAEVKNERVWVFHHTPQCTYANQTHMSTTYPTCSVCGHVAGTSCATAEEFVSPSKIYHEYVMSYELIHDAREHILVEDIREFVLNIAPAERFDPSCIVDVEFFPYGSDSVDYTIEKRINTAYIASMDATTNETLIENNQGGAEFIIVDNKINLSPIPQQYAPIILYADDNPHPYTQVFFTDSNGKFVLENTEEFESLGFQTLYLKYLDIDLLSIQITIDGTANTDYTIINNIVKFNYIVPEGSIIKIKYKLKQSYAVNYNYDSDSFDLEINKETGVDGEELVNKIKIFFEANKLSACRQLNHISLNPIYNVRHSGYIYICDYQDPPQTVNVCPADDFIYANGKDEMNVLIQVLDKNQNPIENVNVNVIAAKGDLDVINSKTDMNGVIHCRYTSATENCIDVIKATVDDNAKGQAKIVNRKL